MAVALDTSGVTTYDLTDNSIIKNGSMAVRTPDETVIFSIRNRIDWTNDVGSARPTIDANAGTAGSAGLANIFRVLKIPDRTVIERIVLASDTLSWSHSHTGAVGASAFFGFQVMAYVAATKVVASMVRTETTAGCGVLAITNSGGAVAGLPTVVASTPWTATQPLTVTTTGLPLYLPFGGYIDIQAFGGASTSAVTADGSFAGVGHVIAHCTRIPE
uniref:Uncharacterized protein n=1 Tax=viral metagenome TaxID=1070528 RepID=A0A6H1ZJ61_9ZZZZ